MSRKRRTVLESILDAPDTSASEKLRAAELLQNEPDSLAADVAREVFELGDDELEEELDTLTAARLRAILAGRESAERWPLTAAVLHGLALEGTRRWRTLRRALRLRDVSPGAQPSEAARDDDDAIDAPREPAIASAVEDDRAELALLTPELDFKWPDERPRRPGSLRF